MHAARAVLLPTQFSIAAGSPASSFDPWTHCARVIDQDDIGDEHLGDRLAPVLIAPLRASVGFADDRPDALLVTGTHWRCMGGKVWACHVGANLPCGSKADTRRQPGEGSRAFCRDEPDADSIRAYATGHETVFRWRCKGGSPHIVRQIFKVDPRGFPADFWSRVEPPATP